MSVLSVLRTAQGTRKAHQLSASAANGWAGLPKWASWKSYNEWGGSGRA